MQVASLVLVVLQVVQMLQQVTTTQMQQQMMGHVLIQYQLMLIVMEIVQVELY
jgi:hypothetical protein